jgi:hypothetical protein
MSSSRGVIYPLGSKVVGDTSGSSGVDTKGNLGSEKVGDSFRIFYNTMRTAFLN